MVSSSDGRRRVLPDLLRGDLIDGDPSDGCAPDFRERAAQIRGSGAVVIRRGAAAVAYSRGAGR